MKAGISATIATLLLLGSRLAGAASGLANVQEIRTGDDFTEPFHGAEAVAVAPDGAFVYAVSPATDAVTVFSRVPATGVLTLASAVTGTDPGVSGLDGPKSLAITPDGAHLYVGTREDVVVAFSRNPLSGALTFIEAEPAVGSAKDLTVSPDGANVYVVSDAQNTLQVFTRNTGTGDLTPLETHEDGVSGVDGLRRASGVVVSPDGKHVYATGALDDAVAVFGRSLVTGALTFITSYTDSANLPSPNDVAISPDGLHLYIAPAASSSGGLTVYSRDALTGLLTFVEVGATSGETFVFIRATASVTVSPDGTKVIGGARSSIVLFDRNALTGSLTFVGGEQQRNERVRMSPDGAHVYAASGSSDLGVYRLISLACSATPMSGCKTPTISLKSSVLLKEGSTDQGDRFKWKWANGQATTLAEFGNPIGGTDDMMVCLYDASVASQPVFRTVAPAGGICVDKPCWKTSGSTPGKMKLKYSDKARRPDGLAKLDAKEGIAGEAFIRVRGQDQFLMMPALPLTPPVRVQLQSTTGNCWEAIYSTVQDNDAQQYKAKDD